MCWLVLLGVCTDLSFPIPLGGFLYSITTKSPPHSHGPLRVGASSPFIHVSLGVLSKKKKECFSDNAKAQEPTEAKEVEEGPPKCSQLQLRARVKVVPSTGPPREPAPASAPPPQGRGSRTHAAHGAGGP